MDWLLEFSPFRQSQFATVVSGALGLAFFGGVVIYCVRRNDRDRMPAFLLLSIGSASVILRGLFGAGLSTHPASLGGVWRILNAGVFVAGLILLERSRRRASSERRVRAVR